MKKKQEQHDCDKLNIFDFAAYKSNERLSSALCRLFSFNEIAVLI